MFSINLLTFNKKFFFFYFFAHIIVVAILGNSRAFAPDELSYINCFTALYESDFNQALFGGWWTSNTIYLRILYLPIKIFTFLPISDLILLRIYSIILTSIALFLLIRYTKVTSTYFGKLTLVVFTFTPSIFLWTTLAIKESFILLNLVVFFLGLEKIYKSTGSAGYFMCLLSGYSLFNLKGYLFVILFFSIVLIVIIKSIRLFKIEKSSLLLLFILLVPYAISPATSATILDSAIVFRGEWSKFRALEDSSQTDSSQTDLDAGMTMNLLSKPVNRGMLLEFVLSSLHLKKYLSNKEAFYSDLSSKERAAARSLDPVNPTNLKGFIYGLSAFLFYPNVFRSNGSPILDLLGFEIIFWIFLYVVAIYTGWQTRARLMKFTSISLITYSSCFLLVSEITEINLGTALRHRLVLAVLLVIFISFQNSQIKNTSNAK